MQLLRRTAQSALILVCIAHFWSGCSRREELPEQTGPIRAYFSNYGSEVTLEQRLLSEIAHASHQIDMAIYSLELDSVVDALRKAKDRGVEVRVVTESKNADEQVERLRAAGISVVLDNNSRLMHDKFVVFDRYRVWTGSYNFTYHGTYHNDENVVVLDSSKVARLFEEEFEEMFSAGLFGRTSPRGEGQTFLVGDTKVEVYFSPDDDVGKRLSRLIRNSSSRLRFMAFSFTSDPLGAAVMSAYHRGIDVRGVIERQQNDRWCEFEKFRTSGVNVRLDSNRSFMHHKVMVVDDAVVTGSYNFSKSAEEYNDENLLILHSPRLAKLYLAEFDRLDK